MSHSSLNITNTHTHTHTGGEQKTKRRRLNQTSKDEEGTSLGAAVDSNGEAQQAGQDGETTEHGRVRITEVAAASEGAAEAGMHEVICLDTPQQSLEY
jgi:hypothetical protein